MSTQGLPYEIPKKPRTTHQKNTLKSTQNSTTGGTQNPSETTSGGGSTPPQTPDPTGDSLQQHDEAQVVDTAPVVEKVPVLNSEAARSEFTGEDRPEHDRRLPNVVEVLLVSSQSVTKDGAERVLTVTNRADLSENSEEALSDSTDNDDVNSEERREPERSLRDFTAASSEERREPRAFTAANSEERREPERSLLDFTRDQVETVFTQLLLHSAFTLRELYITDMVCRKWRKAGKHIWLGIDQLRLRVPSHSYDLSEYLSIYFAKNPKMADVTLIMERDLKVAVLGIVRGSFEKLKELEIQFSDPTLKNHLTGKQVADFLKGTKLKTLKLTHCGNVNNFTLSSSLVTLSLSGLHSVSTMVFQHSLMLKELSLCFSNKAEDTTNLVEIAKALGEKCPNLNSLYIDSAKLSDTVVQSLVIGVSRSAKSKNPSGLKKLCLVSGADITDASVDVIADCFKNLTWLNLSGSSITDSALTEIHDYFKTTLSVLILVRCPNLTSSGIQIAGQLPNLEYMDCSYTFPQEDICQNTLICGPKLKKCSMYGCSSIRMLTVVCPKLTELNLGDCDKLEVLSIKCPNLMIIEVGCPRLKAIKTRDIPAPTYQVLLDQVNENVEIDLTE